MKTADQDILQLLREIKAAGGSGGGDYILASAMDTDGTLAANSDGRVATQKAVKTYVDAHAAHSGGVIGTAHFDPHGGAISALFNNGVISGISYNGVGNYSVGLSGQADANYSYSVEVNGDAGAPLQKAFQNVSTGGFDILVFTGPDEAGHFTPAEAFYVTVTISRLSQ